MALAWLFVLVGAASPTEPLRWSAPPECPRADAVQAMIEAHTGAPLLPGTIDVDAHVEAIGDDGYRLTLVVEHAAIRQERMLVARECDALAHASALVVALGIDATAVAQVEREALAQPLPSPATPDGERTSAGWGDILLIAIDPSSP